MEFQNYLSSLGACREALYWVGNKERQEAWEQCEKPDWLLFLLKKEQSENKKLFVLIAIEIAESVLKYVKQGEERPRLAIEAAKTWVNNPSEENRRSSRLTAYAAYAAAAAADAAYAAADAAAAAAAAAAYAAADAAAAARTEQQKTNLQLLLMVVEAGD